MYGLLIFTLFNLKNICLELLKKMLCQDYENKDCSKYYRITKPSSLKE